MLIKWAPVQNLQALIKCDQTLRGENHGIR